MKNLKTKLLAAVAMLAVSAICLTSATFAWFTLSTNPEITGMTTQVVTNENLEIALVATGAAAPTAIPSASAIKDTGTDTTWGNLINFTISNNTLRPMMLDTSTGKFYYPTYGKDGRPSETAEVEEGTGYGTQNMLVGTKYYAYYFDIWVRSNMSGDLKLSEAAKRSSDGEQGNGSTFKTVGVAAGDANQADKLSVAKALATNIRVGFKDITPNVDGAETAAAADTLPVVATNGTPETETDTQEGTLKETNYKVTLTCNDVVTLNANEAKLIRVYVFLDGETVTNASASTGNFTSTGTINLQFALEGVDKSMDGES